MIDSFKSFSLARLPRIEFGRGVFRNLPQLVESFGQQILLVTGRASFLETQHWVWLCDELKKRGIQFHHTTVEGEPSPQFVDSIVAGLGTQQIDVVVGIGGGSVLDAAKAIAGLLKIKNSVLDFLEGVGAELAYTGPAVPFIAVPTTAGTGSEATKNAVLSVQGKDGYKKSFRDEKLVAEYAIVDPALLATCSPALIAANGMDALTQLLESYVSIRANTFTDALVISGLRAARDGLLDWYEHGSEAHAAQDRMAYAAMLSGITLAQVGLGSVHGLASPLGAYFPIPHGVVCGTLVAAATQVNIEALAARDADGVALAKYARLGDVLCERRHASAEKSRTALLDLLGAWTERMGLPRLASYGVDHASLDMIVANSRGSSMKTNPIVLTDDEVKTVLRMRL
jgi:alcohol dehydrogenase